MRHGNTTSSAGSTQYPSGAPAARKYGLRRAWRPAGPGGQLVRVAGMTMTRELPRRLPEMAASRVLVQLTWSVGMLAGRARAAKAPADWAPAGLAGTGVSTAERVLAEQRTAGTAADRGRHVAAVLGGQGGKHLGGVPGGTPSAMAPGRRPGAQFKMYLATSDRSGYIASFCSCASSSSPGSSSPDGEPDGELAARELGDAPLICPPWQRLSAPDVGRCGHADHWGRVDGSVHRKRRDAGAPGCPGHR